MQQQNNQRRAAAAAGAQQQQQQQAAANNNNNNNNPERVPIRDFSWLFIALIFCFFNIDTLVSIMASTIVFWMISVFYAHFGLALTKTFVSCSFVFPFQYFISSWTNYIHAMMNRMNATPEEFLRRQQRNDENNNNDNNNNNNNNDGLRIASIFKPPTMADSMYDAMIFVAPRYISLLVVTAICPIYSVPYAVISTVLGRMSLFVGEWAETVVVLFHQHLSTLNALQAFRSPVPNENNNNDTKSNSVNREIRLLRMKYRFFMIRAIGFKIFLALTLSFFAGFCFYHSFIVPYSAATISRSELRALHKVQRRERTRDEKAKSMMSTTSSSADDNDKNNDNDENDDDAHGDDVEINKDDHDFVEIFSGGYYAPANSIERTFLRHDASQHPAVKIVPGFVDLLVESQAHRYGIKYISSEKNQQQQVETKKGNSNYAIIRLGAGFVERFNLFIEYKFFGKDSSQRKGKDGDDEEKRKESKSVDNEKDTHDKTRKNTEKTQKGSTSSRNSDKTKKSNIMSKMSFYGIVTVEHLNTALALLLLDFVNQAIRTWIKVVEMIFVYALDQSTFPEYGDSTFFLPRILHRLTACSFACVYCLQATGYAPRLVFTGVVTLLEKIVRLLIRKGLYFSSSSVSSSVLSSNSDIILQGNCISYYLANRQTEDENYRQHQFDQTTYSARFPSTLHEICNSIGGFLFQAKSESNIYVYDNSNFNYYFPSSSSSSSNDQQQYWRRITDIAQTSFTSSSTFFSFSSASSHQSTDQSWFLSQNSPSMLPWYWQLVLGLFLLKYFDAVVDYEEWTNLMNSFKSLTPQVLREEVIKRRLDRRAREEERRAQREADNVLDRALVASQSPAPDRPPLNDEENTNNNNNNNNNNKNNNNSRGGGGRSLSALSHVSDVVELQCCVCLETLEKEVLEDGKILPCGHIFHGRCLCRVYATLNSKCPVCRAPMWGPRNNNNNNNNNRNRNQQQRARQNENQQRRNDVGADAVPQQQQQRQQQNMIFDADLQQDAEDAEDNAGLIDLLMDLQRGQ